ncbi:3-dehydroquinate synthase, partial [Dissostichus eleginoides]
QRGGAGHHPDAVLYFSALLQRSEWIYGAKHTLTHSHSALYNCFSRGGDSVSHSETIFSSVLFHELGVSSEFCVCSS